MAGGPSRVYSRGNYAVLPSDDSDLENIFIPAEYDQVAVDDGDRVVQEATGEYSVFLFRDRHSSQEDIKRTWNGQSDRSAGDSIIYLQIFNRNTELWETIDSDNISPAGTDFNLEMNITTGLDDYYDGDFWVACRIYQEAI